MFFRKKELDVKAIAIDYETSLSSDQLAGFRQAVDLYRKGEALKQSYDEKAHDVLSHTFANPDEETLAEFEETEPTELEKYNDMLASDYEETKPKKTSRRKNVKKSSKK